MREAIISNVEFVRTCLMYVCVAGLVVILAAVFLGKVFAPAWEALRKFASLPRIQQVFLGFLIVGLIQYGATKSTFSYDGGIKAGTEQNVSTNDLVKIYWQRDTSGGEIVPTSAAVYIDYRVHDSTNEWGMLAQTTVGAWSWSGTVANATNYDYKVWAYYIPPEPVHTNGVWVYKTLKDRAKENAIPLRARVELEGQPIATPKQKRSIYEVQ